MSELNGRHPVYELPGHIMAGGKGSAGAGPRNTRHFGTAPKLTEDDSDSSDPDYEEGRGSDTGKETEHLPSRPAKPTAVKKYHPPKPDQLQGRNMVAGKKRKPTGPKRASRETVDERDEITAGPEKTPKPGPEKTRKPRQLPNPALGADDSRIMQVHAAGAAVAEGSGGLSGSFNQAGPATQTIAHLFNEPAHGPTGHQPFGTMPPGVQNTVTVAEFNRLENAFQNSQRQNDILARTLETVTNMNARVVADKDRFQAEALKLRE